jgi:hypothetical protein
MLLRGGKLKFPYYSAFAGCVSDFDAFEAVLLYLTWHINGVGASTASLTRDPARPLPKLGAADRQI